VREINNIHYMTHTEANKYLDMYLLSKYCATLSLLVLLSDSSMLCYNINCIIIIIAIKMQAYNSH